MGKELPLARKKEERQPVLLVRAGNGEFVPAPSIRDPRTEEPDATEGSKGGKVKDTKAKGKSGSKVKGANARPRRQRHRRDNQDREQDRGDEGEDSRPGRSAQELGIVYPGSYCDELETVPHYWNEVDVVAKGSLYQCRFCYRHLWLPLSTYDAEQLSKLIRKYGSSKGYCYYLNRHRPAKLLIAKLQDLRMLETEITDRREFARLTDKILSDKEYDRKETQ